ncbi:MAG: ComEC/Rec2 family competence protein [Bacteroidota bacterium]|nr:ComEC/Rec2 family competence protein [Bacteroidota bacterium]
MKWLINFIQQFFRVRQYNKERIIQTQHINPWHQVPFVRMVLPLVLGIALSTYFTWAFDYLQYVFVGLVCILFILVFYQSKFVRKLKVIYTVCLNLAFIILGLLLPITQADSYKNDHFVRLQKDEKYIKVELVENAVPREKSVRAKAKVLAVLNDSNYTYASGNILLYLPKDSDAIQLEHGSILLLSGKPIEIPKPLNPGEFDYNRYMKINSYSYQVFARDGEWEMVGKDSSHVLDNLFYSIKKYIVGLYKNYIPGDEQKGVAAALIFGYREDLSQDLVEAYADTGTLHVLAVSGLHVGILYFVLKALLGFLTRKKSLRILRFCIIVVTLWFYALITGLSPSVNRAALMFTIIIIAETFHRNTNIYNSIAASAFILLLINPYSLYDVGFQLSYLAVLGIVFLHPRIYSWFTFNNWFTNQVWNITAVSIAAQLATSPLGFYYFGQFPNYFLISNLLIIPLSTIITYIGLLLVAFSFIPLLASSMGIALDYLIKWTDDTVKFIGQIPYATFEGVSIGFWQTLLLLIIFFFVTQFFTHKNKYTFYTASLFMVVFLCTKMIENYQWQQQKKIFVYAIQGKTVVGFFDSHNLTAVGDTNILYNKATLKFKFQKHWVDMGATEKNLYALNDTQKHTTNRLQNYKNLYIFNGKKILIIDQTPTTAFKDSVDIAIISHKPMKHWEDLAGKVKARHYIADLSNSNYYIDRWKKEALLYKSNFTDCRKGAVELVVE